MAITQVAAIGDNCVDIYVGEPGLRAVGGSALNVAVNFQRAGFPSTYLGAIADDPPGAEIRDGLARAGVNTRLQTLPGATAVTRLRLKPDGDREFLHEDFGVGLDYRPNAADLDSLIGCAWVHCAGLSDPLPTVRALLERGIQVSYDFTTHPWPDDLRGVAVAFFSPGDDDPVDLARRAIRAGAGVAVVTLGADGSIASDGANEVRVPAVPTTVVDTCGAGDSYIAAFLIARLRGRDLETAMREGAIAGAAACRHHAAWPQDGVLV